MTIASDQEAVAPRRSAQERHQPNYYHDMEWSHLSISQSELKSFEEAITSPGSSKYNEAMEAEMSSLKNNDVWELLRANKGTYSLFTCRFGTP